VKNFQAIDGGNTVLSGNSVRTRNSKNRIIPLYLETHQGNIRQLAEHLISEYQLLVGSSRTEIAANFEESVVDQATQLVQNGFIELLEDYCTFESEGSLDPAEVRSRLFVAAANIRKELKNQPLAQFNRSEIMQAVAAELQVDVSEVERCFFADLKGEHRLIRFDPPALDAFLDRYNVALAQAILLRSTRLEVLISGENPNRFRRIARTLKFHRLWSEIQPGGKDAYRLVIEGPMSLFRSTQKYGLQIALFLPHLLQCQRFELTAHLKWGPQKKDKIFTLDQSQGLKSHLPDYSTLIHSDLQIFFDAFDQRSDGWTLDREPALVTVGNQIWVPDATLIHPTKKKQIYLEVLGFWRKTDLQKHLQELRKALPGQFLLAVPDSLNTDHDADIEETGEVYYFKRTPSVERICERANSLSRSFD
jgi:uncharacterized protein